MSRSLTVLRRDENIDDAITSIRTAGVRRVSAVCPGVIHTEMIARVTGKDPGIEKQFVNMEPMGRMGTPQEIAEAAVWLCSPAASFITGQALAIDGGLVAR
jgi:NAD(P)-dependent dehydrogenase (short-subunit alcohol dehydrogenase family)